jgi:hypothetical protein
MKRATAPFPSWPGVRMGLLGEAKYGKVMDCASGLRPDEAVDEHWRLPMHLQAMAPWREAQSW